MRENMRKIQGRPASGRSTRNWLIGLLLAGGLTILGLIGTRLWTAHRVRQELAEARKEMEAGLLGSARKRLIWLAEHEPEQAEVAYQLGRCEAERGRPEAALKAWARLAPGSLWAVRAAVESAQASIALGRINQAQRTAAAALRQPSPGVPVLRHLLLILLGQQGRIVEARRLIESLWHDTAVIPASDMADRLAMVHEYAGLDLETFPLEWNLSRLEGAPQPADDEDRRALALSRTYLATRTGDFQRALSEIQSYVRQWPDDPMGWKSWLEWAVAADRPEEARAALRHVPAREFDPTQILELRAWFARQRQDAPVERRALEELLERGPGRIAALTRLAELLQQAGDSRAAAELRRRKADLDAALDRYYRLYKQDRYADHLAELAALAERLGRWFEARAFWTLIAAAEPSNADAIAALDRLNPTGAAVSPVTGTLADVIAASPERARASQPGPSRRGVAEHGPLPRFEDGSTHAGLADFIQDNGVTPIHQLPEMASGGGGLLDFDRDGFLDVYCVQGGAFPPAGMALPAVGDGHDQDARATSGDRLYRNRGDGTFEDVTRKAGIGGMPRGYGHGVAVGDYDNDGYPDLLVTRWRSYALYHNRGDATFEDATEKAGLGGDRDWPTSAAFADLDNDGDLDLYVCHYGVWDTAHPEICKDPSGTVILSCDPRRIASRADHVFRNDGGRFVDMTARSGMVDRDGRGLGVVAADLDEDGRIDLFVANDTTANFLFRNLGGFRFQEVGHESGVAANAGGGYQAGMGVACGDLDGDGRLDLAITNFYGESTTLFHNLGQGLFADHTAVVRLTAPSRHWLGFGVAFLDANDDGWLDLLTANGHVSDQRPLFPYAMTPQLFLGNPAGTLTDVSARAGPPFQQPYVGRGLAVGDLDNDGRLDAVMVVQNEPLVYLHNLTERGGLHFITFQLEGTKSNRDGVGAVLAVSAGGRTRIAPRFGGGSYQSAGDPRLHFGLGSSDRVESVEVRWPSGRVHRVRNLDVDCGYRLIEGDESPKLLEGFRH
jgi:enediyne biosynthesis protein E4